VIRKHAPNRRAHPTSSGPQTSTVGPLLQATRTVPIVFPVASIRSPLVSL
jgi:hypothetical protein